MEIWPIEFEEIFFSSHRTSSTYQVLGVDGYLCTWSHNETHIGPVGLSTNDRPISEASTCTTRYKHKRQIFMPPAEFEPAIPAIDQPQVYALDCTATGTGLKKYVGWK
jgi:hypothetical protein